MTITVRESKVLNKDTTNKFITMESEELNELYKQRRDLAERIANYFHNGIVNEDDKGYQKLQTKLERIEEQINDFIDDSDN